jgi:hypothetical protein
MRPWRERRLRGSFTTRDIAPPDLARGMERDRTRFLSSLLVDPSTWEIARTLQRHMRGRDGEGLRGVFVPSSDGPGRLFWWIAGTASHAQGRRMLPPDMRADVMLEVEMNVGTDGTVYPCWSGFDDEDGILSEAFLAHPTIGPLMEGSITRGGRQIVLGREGRSIRLLASPAPAVDLGEIEAAASLEDWSRLETEAGSWSRARSGFAPDGRTLPDRRSIRLFRRWLGREWHGYAAPLVSIDGDAVVAEWRSTDHYLRVAFDGDDIHVREIDGGRLREERATGLDTEAKVRRDKPSLPIHRFPPQTPRS